MNDLASRYQQVRTFTEVLAEPLTAEDCAIQSMPDASPTRWHLAHTTWFFETFLLASLPGYEPYNPQFAYLFNSYYNTLGEQFPRARRGLLSRPSLQEIRAFRHYVDEHVVEGMNRQGPLTAEQWNVLEIGLNHEQQHQELILTDIKHMLSCNPLLPTYRDGTLPTRDNGASKTTWTTFDGGLELVGHASDGFAYDNESPRHQVWLAPYALADRLVTCGEYLDFIEDQGYSRPDLWLSLGWDVVLREEWEAPLYWRRLDGAWHEFTLAGLQPIDRARPVCHVSFFEADAFARWAGARLPNEFEWEVAARQLNTSSANFADTLLAAGAAIHPLPTNGPKKGSPQQMYGDVWEWTSSPYVPYPGYRPPTGALGEYNGKFMCNQYVLRGGSCATPSGHIRSTYRNFFPPEARWQFTGMRLARDPA